jgi:hypothetical protein
MTEMMNTQSLILEVLILQIVLSILLDLNLVFLKVGLVKKIKMEIGYLILVILLIMVNLWEWIINLGVRSFISWVMDKIFNDDINARNKALRGNPSATVSDLHLVMEVLLQINSLGLESQIWMQLKIMIQYLYQYIIIIMVKISQ